MVAKGRRDAIRAFNVLLLGDVWGFSVAEIAVELGLSERTIRRARFAGHRAVPPRVIEALKRLAAEVSDHGFHVDPDQDDLQIKDDDSSW